ALAAVLSGLTAELRAQGIGAPQGGSSANGVGSEGVESLLDGSGTNRYYKLGPGDIIDVRVFGEPQFNGQVEVDEDGNIEIPFVEKPINVK
ncbi:polysaccharide biosynthesis/export family protein, partial [Escherichia coli]|nr:polysaccharide biosynthesis/export family protein [Escherichia coli]